MRRKIDDRDFEFLARLRKTSIAFGLFISPFVATYIGLGAAAGWLAGIAWSLVNLFLITGLIRSATGSGRTLSKSLLFATAKFPVLYSVGYLLLNCGLFPVASLLAGFVWPFFVATLKALGRVFLRLDDSRTNPIREYPRAEVGAGR